MTPRVDCSAAQRTQRPESPASEPAVGHAYVAGACQGVALLLWSADPAEPVRLSTPFFHAAAAAALEVQVEVYFSAASVQLLAPGVADRLHSGPSTDHSVAGAMRMAHQHGARFFACADALKAQGLRREALIDLCSGLGGSVQFMARTIDPAWRALVY